MTVDELKIYFRGYLSGNYLKSLKMDIGVQINDLKDHIIRMFSLIDSVPKKNHYNNATNQPSPSVIHSIFSQDRFTRLLSNLHTDIPVARE